jgi:serpin B
MERALQSTRVMKTFRLALLVAVGSLVACAAPTDEQPAIETVRSSLARNTAPIMSPVELDTLSTDQAAFAVSLYREVASSPGSAGQNVFLSPHSVSTALAMAYAGARGDTRAEMKQALHFGLDDARLHAGFDYLDLALSSRGQDAKAKDGEPFRISVANSLWAQKGAAFEAPFLDTLAVSYGAGVNVVDFGKATEPARLAINGWVEEKTESRIKDLIHKDGLSSATRLVLVNAVYFNAAWSTKFADGATAPAPFTRLDGSVAQVATMHTELTARYTQDAAFEAIELPYDGGDTSMLVIAPAKGTFAAFEGSLTGGKVLDVLAGLEEKPVRLSFPKAKVDGRFDLVQPLRAMGMKAAFEGTADFGGISATERLQIGGVVHQTFLDIDEGGTEAAAATEISFVDTAYHEPPTFLPMNVDRPYLVAIVDRQTKTLLFMGRIVDPK